MTTFIFLLFISSKLLVINASCHEQEREALMSFKSNMADPSNRLSSWKGQNCCSWYGINCSDSFHVTAIDLRNPKLDNLILDMNSQLVSTSDVPSTALTGTIPPSLFSLTHLRYLDLSFNNFSFSKVPLGFSKLTGLTYLNLSNVMFNGSITTQFSNLTLLMELDLSCSSSIDDYSSIYTTLSSTPTIHEGSTYTYMKRGNLYAPNLSWLQRLNNLRKLKLSGVDLSKASRSNLWAKSVSTLSKLKLLELSNCRISGEVPVEQLLNLTKLSELYMDYNFLASKIPSKLANLTSLSVLDLTRSYLQGHIPYLPQVKTLHVGNNVDVMVDLHSMFSVPWPRLESIDISSTHVIGSIPSSIANITSLVDFIAYNSLIQGRIPASMMNLSRLEMLRLDMNNISGEISPSISNLKSLQVLSLLQNSFHGLIPDTICSISSLWCLLLAGNSFTGNIPNCIGQLNDLSHLETTLKLRNNLLQGLIPQQLENIRALDLSANNFTGNVPAEVGLGNIRYLALSDNKLSGRIPFSLCQENCELMLLDLSNNNLVGTIPTSFGNCSPLLYLNLGSNNLTDGIPEELQGAKRLRFLNVSGNHFDGPFPSVVRRLERISVIDMGNNKFSGKIPEFIGDLKDLRILLLEFNSFNGSIPEEINALENMQFIGLSNNQLSGPIPEKLSGLKTIINRPKDGNLLGFIISQLYIGVQVNLVAKGLSMQFDVVRTYNNGLDLSCNNLTGNLPSELGHLQGLYALNLSHNRLSGNIPTAIGNMSLLESLDLSYNNLSGEIPVSLALLDPLSTLNLAHNNLSGEIPTSPHFDTLSRDGLAYIGNKFLCGAPDGIHCDSEDFPTPESSESEHSEEQCGEWKMVLALAFAGYVVGFWGLFGVVYLVNEKWRKAYWASVDRIVDGIIRCRKIRVSSVKPVSFSSFYLFVC
ncbi:hypothetical protein ES332_D02G096500v1 [Gossypium tomentosum]|uniref:Leucine-rich repeat-containing N-terminal plant-type domain-containing protein n=1 Tax=Gossypium tomentosum TaxID=34277 RepID=A0A5D2LV59_GOSTO|nr:hypothetical protein ES332_D02G096500v1 [Gossypium tomentosum]